MAGRTEGWPPAPPAHDGPASGAAAPGIRAPGGPVVLTRPGPHGPVIHAADAAARARGLAPGGRVVDAQAVHPDLRVEPGDPEGDAALLGRLALWSRRWCPWTVAEGPGPDGADPDGIVLDATGSAHLFGGEPAMLNDIVRRLGAQGLTARVAMAPTRAAAHALARHEGPGSAPGPDGVRDVRAMRAARGALRQAIRDG